ncbi:ABC transporter ATP-binding protein [Archangium violaceum]|uniref:ABC transporter ATP-binding protein n=1 Tax=Archangium violaceum TaxID=83451 RepID=UPI002B27C595|nr:ABC transporter ATP-binding protein [Archangium gephyra]
MVSPPPVSASPSTLDPGRGGVRVRISGIRRTFSEGVSVLNGLDLDVAAGSFVALVGPSGCGKSTLLRLVAGLDRPDAGTLTFSPPLEHTPGARPPIAFVFQDAHLLPWRSVLDNVALPLELAGVPAPERHASAHALLKEVGLGDATSRYPAQLSGGMRMRVSLARALVTRPRLLLLDEPFAALDELTRNRLDDQLLALWKELGMTVLFVTHSLSEAAYLAERVVVLSRRPARVMMDRQLALPPERLPALRADPGFAREMGLLLQALEQGEAA